MGLFCSEVEYIRLAYTKPTKPVNSVYGFLCALIGSLSRNILGYSWLIDCTQNWQHGVPVPGKFERSSNFRNKCESHPNQHKESDKIWFGCFPRYGFIFKHSTCTSQFHKRSWNCNTNTKQLSISEFAYKFQNNLNLCIKYKYCNFILYILYRLVSTTTGIICIKLYFICIKYKYCNFILYILYRLVSTATGIQHPTWRDGPCWIESHSLPSALCLTGIIRVNHIVSRSS